MPSTVFLCTIVDVQSLWVSPHHHFPLQKRDEFCMFDFPKLFLKLTLLQHYNKAFSLEQGSTGLIGTGAHPRHLHSSFTQASIMGMLTLHILRRNDST